MRTVIGRLTERQRLSDDTALFTFTLPPGQLRDLAPGAHVDVRLSEDLVRSYSLTGWDEGDSWLQVAVKREPEGRGGSVAMHLLAVGDEVTLSEPRNAFALRDLARPVVLIGGGIGITPLVAMARFLNGGDRDFELHYLVRTASMAAFGPLLGEQLPAGTYHLHCDDSDGLLDFEALVDRHRVDTLFYVCGPEPMLRAVQSAVASRGRGEVVFERFAALSTGAAAAAASPFTVVIASTGQELDVAADQSMLTVLRAAGFDIDYSCSEGTCGTCVTDVLEGEIDHRDSILDDDERAAGDCVCVCVSRAAGERLLLDL